MVHWQVICGQTFFTLFELTDIMRQKDDKLFAELLNRLREGKHSEQDIDCLKERVLHTAPRQETYPMETTHLCTANASVNAHNNSMYAKCESDKCQIKAIDIVIGDISDDLKKQMKDKIPNDPTKTMGLYSLTPIATNAKYDLTTNANVTDGLKMVQNVSLKKLTIGWKTLVDLALYGYYFQMLI